MLLRHALAKHHSIQDRVILIVKFADLVIPGIARKLSRRIYVNHYFPWQPVPIELVTYGTGAAVFHKKLVPGDKALRIYRQSVGRSPTGLLEVARYYKMKYETVLAWYGGPLDLVLPMEFLVVEGLPYIGPVVVSFQPYVHGQTFDLFDDLSDEEVLKLLEENIFLREQVLFFTEQTIHQWEEGRECYDFLGNKNVIFVQEHEEYRLRIVDVGSFRLDVLAKTQPDKWARIEQRMKKIIHLHQLARKLTGRMKDSIYPHNAYGQVI